ncbi:(Fe-S)-binding protein [Flavobacteriaceae bacterium]|nr:(Fe-S)-binding protein [Flavobacteriaceae bacterium]MDA9084238.1 (Fe-S)-binding protein [Flavobacteriaceae bacterium]MDB2366591.1 (Fe-S)-binding protein [Flavobacteriaceae bacterium]MDB3874634.1 (Fe-S)-binding protein [Flavobacteriaceae bacterium]
MEILPNIIFSFLLIISLGFFGRNIKKLIRVINLGKPVDRSDNPVKRLSNMIKIALGQSKMVTKPISGALHVIVYLGFIIINIEVLEILIDGVTGSHRFFSKYFNTTIYNFLIASFEIFALLVLISVIIFWTRRNLLKIKRFLSSEMKGWPKFDADNILYFEVVLMMLFLSMNATDLILQERNFEGYYSAGSFPVSSFMVPIFDSFTTSTVFLLERTFWWSHIIGIFFFLNYLYYSKHLHILLAFPNTYYANLEEKGKFDVLESVKNEVLLMFYPEKASQNNQSVDKFGASDVLDLNWVQLMNAYSCTECGRCTSECPANLTGKKLSPRKIMMDTRDRLEKVSKNISNNNGKFVDDGDRLLDNYISKEELWACTSCNACVEACPINIDPLSIIMDMRQYLIMEESSAHPDLNNMMNNIENNGAPWPYNQQDRELWIQET